MEKLRAIYGQGPLHLIAVVASFAIATYAFLEIADTSHPINFAIWFVGAIVAHDMIAFPLYSALGAIAGAGLQRPDLTPGLFSINFVRIPALLSAFVFIVWFPIILGLSETEVVESTGLGTSPFLGRWLLLTGVLFLASGTLYAVKLRRVRT
jgi:hypothetical protein